MRKIEFYFKGEDHLEIDKIFLKNKIEEVFAREHHEYGDISVILCNDDFLLEINRDFLKHDYYTDIITFDNTEKNRISGELYISYERVRENAISYHKTFENELTRVVIHGILHLLGYSDDHVEEKRRMTEKEDFYLSSKG